MFDVDQGDDLPHAIDLDYNDFLTYRGDWKLYRSMGHYDANGAWIKPLSFLDAMKLPKAMIDTFLELDDFLERMKRHRAKKKGAK